MRLPDLVARLMSARQTLPVEPVYQAAQRAAARATYNSLGRFSFHVERTPTGAKIIGYSLVGAPVRLADAVVRQHLEPELERARQEIGQAVRESLTS